MLSKKSRLISKKLKDLKDTRQASFILNKRVLSKSGEYVGKVQDLILKDDVMQGVFVVGKRKLVIGREFIASVSRDHLMLNIEPVTNMIGKQVFDSKGKSIGKVKEVLRKSNTNSYSDLKIKGALFKRSFLIPKTEVAVAKKSIILKNPYENEKAKQKKKERNNY